MAGGKRGSQQQTPPAERNCSRIHGYQSHLGDVVLTEDEDGSLWHAEIPFVDEDEGSSGYYLLTFTKQNNKWKISQGLLSR